MNNAKHDERLQHTRVVLTTENDYWLMYISTTFNATLASINDPKRGFISACFEFPLSCKDVEDTENLDKDIIRVYKWRSKIKMKVKSWWSTIYNSFDWRYINSESWLFIYEVTSTGTNCHQVILGTAKEFGHGKYDWCSFHDWH